jgi:Tol biopolymer transport system component
MIGTLKKYGAFLFFLLTFTLQITGQFYYGTQMEFGKNRVQYNDFYWYFYRYEKFDTYFNQEGKALANYTADYLSEEIARAEEFFDYTLEKRLIFIVYNKLSDFRQSNIGLVSGKEETNTGGITKVIRNKVFVYFDGDHKKFEQQISAAIAEVIINEILYGNEFRENFTNSTLINLPDWYMKGLISFMSRGWDFEVENFVKDGILSGEYKRFNWLTGDDAKYAGHSFWKYIADTYGESVIPNILYLTRINKNSNNGFLYVVGFSVKDLSRDWLAYYKEQYDEKLVERELPHSGKVLRKPNKRRVYNQVKISPDGSKIAYATNELGQYKIFLHDFQTGKTKKILKREHRLDQIPDYTYPILAWHPTGRILSFITEERGGLSLYYYMLETRELTERNLVFFEKVLDFDYSDDGFKIVLSGINRGQSDIYVHTIAAGTNERLTDDIYDDVHPRFINNSKQIIFSSNRPLDTTDYQVDGKPLNSRYLSHNLYVIDYGSRKKQIRRISKNNFVNDVEPFAIGPNKFTFLSDRNGIVNRFVADFDSTISYIDTITHYRYITESYPITNYSRNILEHDYNPKTGQYAEVILHDKRYYMYEDEINPQPNSFGGEFTNTEFREDYTRKLAKIDSLKRIKKEVISIQEIQDNRIITRSEDTISLERQTIDINNYVFEREKLSYYNEQFAGDNVNLVLDTAAFVRPTPRIYETAFYTNYVANQIDFSFLNASYQTFTGGAVYYNPGFNLLFKLGTNDLFEDYRITGGIRLSADFDSNEYLLSFENLKRRLNKQLIFHRQVFKSIYGQDYIKSYSHNLMFKLRWPFSQVSAFEGTLQGRQDNYVYLSTDLKSLNEPNITNYWAGVNLAYIFDNTRYFGQNLYQGMRIRTFVEAYQQVNGQKWDLYTIGADVRYYVKIHRTLIWANRFATGASFGRSRLIYYLGSVDNWINFSSKVQQFDQSVPIDYSRNYVYQTLATNMRGFTQNIRNGDRFAVANTELRWPLVRYFANHPLSNNFLNNFMVVGFADVGTAWNGPNPWSGENAYDNEIIPNPPAPPLTITIDSNREPIVAGYGFGLRSMVLGYWIRLDWAWGIENNIILPRIFYFSMNLDF